MLEMHIPPEVWGPFFWNTIHIAALGYPPNPTHAHKKSAKEFYEALVHMIPCPICSVHYNEQLVKYPIGPHLDTRKDLFRWTLLIHNEVSKSLGKKTFTEEESLDYLKRLGQLQRSPIWSADDFSADDWKSRLQGLVAGIVVGGAGCALLMYLVNSK